MKYEARSRTAVFLGPSLPQPEARQILGANYYPPASFSDIYRLLGTDVELIVVVDGYFHDRASIWPREILAALEAGIAVVGAASLGAIRAVELRPYGMIGIGRVFEGFLSGRLTGDDEVALLHGDASSGYRPVSDPLVEFRFALDAASSAGLVGPREAQALLGDLQQLYFGDRTRPGLFAGPAFQKLPGDRAKTLRKFLEKAPFDAKRTDALAALNYCAQNRTELVAAAQARAVASRQGVVDLALRGVCDPNGVLTTLQELLASRPFATENMGGLVRAARQRYLIERWMGARGLKVPAQARRSYRENWEQQVLAGRAPGEWLVANGMRAAELERELSVRAAGQWLDSLSTEELGIATGGPQSLATADACLLDWARDSGIRVPPEHNTAPHREVDWLLERGPGNFGLAGAQDPSYNEDLALMREFQVRGLIAGWVGGGSPPRNGDDRTLRG